MGLLIEKVGIRSVILLVILASFGCQTPPRYPPGSDVPFMPANTTLKPGDVLEIKFFYTPQLDVTQVVRPDGKIQLQLIGEVDALDKTPGELREELIALYSDHLKHPDVAVIFKSTNTQRVFVGGAVNKAGAIDMTDELTALEAIILAGGFDMTQAEPQNVVIIRHQDRKRFGYSLNMKPMLEEAVEIQPFYLQPRDIIYIPRTTIAKVDQWVDQHITKIVSQAEFFYRVPAGSGTIGIGTSN